MYSFTSDTMQLVDYFAEHGAVLDRVFCSPSPPPLPVSVPQFTQLRPEDVTIQKAEEFIFAKESYDDMRKALKDTAAAFPKSWPVAVPNLSTADLKPSILVGHLADFRVLMVAFNAYMEGLLSLADRWSVALRAVFDVLDDTEALSGDTATTLRAVSTPSSQSKPVKGAISPLGFTASVTRV